MRFVLFELAGEILRLNQETGETWVLQYLEQKNADDKPTWVLVA